MNYTTNYHLPQWVKTDRIMMDDFNQMCADIEAGLTAGDARDTALAQQIEAVKTTAETPALVTGAVRFDASQVGAAIKDFGFAPKLILLLVYGSFAVGGTQRATMYLKNINTSAPSATLFLDGSKLVLKEFDSTSSGLVNYVVFR